MSYNENVIWIEKDLKGRGEKSGQCNALSARHMLNWEPHISATTMSNMILTALSVRLSALIRRSSTENWHFSLSEEVKKFTLVTQHNQTNFCADWKRYSAFRASKRIFIILIYNWNMSLFNHTNQGPVF